MRKTLTLLALSALLFPSCNGENKQQSASSANNEGTASKEAVADQDITKSGFAIKVQEDDFTYVYTCKGSSRRLDTFGPDNHRVALNTKVNKENVAYVYNGSEWKDDLGSMSFYNTEIKDLTKYFVAKGYTKTGTTTILGKTCDVYSGTLEEDVNVMAYDKIGQAGYTGEITVWNGLTMRTKRDGKVETEAKALSFDIPDEAFTKTVDVTWIK